MSDEPDWKIEFGAEASRRIRERIKEGGQPLDALDEVLDATIRKHPEAFLVAIRRALLSKEVQGAKPNLGRAGALADTQRALDAVRNPPQEMVRVRIAVAVNEHAQWACNGSSGGDDTSKAEFAREWLDMDAPENKPSLLASVHFIEADVPVPAVHLVDGKVAD
jgi:hypothetical protein